MTNEPSRRVTPEEQLNEVVAAYRAARAAGQAPTPQEVLARHPDLADRLRPLLAAEDSGAPETLAYTGTPDTPRVDPTTAPTLDVIPPPGGTLPPLPGDFGDYEVLEEIGRGGMGVVFKAREKRLNRVVALKMILAGQLASPEQVRRFRVEAEEAGNLDHPNIVPIYHVGEHNGLPYFTMKLIEGGSLGQQMARYRQDFPAALHLLATVARTVHYAHQRGILHRDLKPANVLLDAQGQPHVTDFGLAKHLEDPATTQSGAILGTPSYMSPEQAAARKDLSVAVDVYALGAILYELLTGQPPFQGDSALETVLRVLEQEPTAPRALNPQVDRDLETICLTCLAKDPNRRYGSALRLAEDLERYLAGEPIQARPAGRLERAVKWARRRPAGAALLGVSVLAVASLSLGGWWTTGRLRAALRDTDRERERAEQEHQKAAQQRDLAEGRRKEADRQRELAETRRKEAEAERRKALASAREAHRQRERAQASFRKRLDVIDDFLIRMDGRLAKAGAPNGVRLEFVHDILQLSEGLLKEDRDDPAVRRQTGLLYRSLGDLWRQQQGFDESQRAYAKALELQKKLADEFRDRPEYRNDLAVTHAAHAQLFRARRGFREAEAAYDEAIKLQDELAARFPKQPEYRERGASYRFNRADLLEEAGQADRAKAGYQDALKRQERLAADYPRSAAYHADLATTATSLASLVGEADRTAAVSHLGRALKAWRRAAKLAPAATQYPRGLHDCYFDLAGLLQRCGRHAELPRLAEELRQDFPNNPNETYNAACLAAYAVPAVGHDARLSDAERKRLVEDYGQQAVRLLDKAVHEGYRDREHMERDADLDPLRRRADYQGLMGRLAKLSPTQARTPAKEYAALQQEVQNAYAVYNYYQGRARTVADRKKAESKRPHFERYVERFLQFAEKHRDSPTAVEALVWVLERTTPPEGGKGSPALARLRRRALKALESDHLQKPELANVCQRLSQSPAADCEDLLRAALEKHSNRDVRGLAGYALALALARHAERARQRGESAAAGLFEQAERQLEQVVKDYAAVSFERTTLGEVARDKLYELRHLSVGRVAPEIEGEDLEGRKFKLSDYRGKVVVVDFWADWCGFCRQMYPHERELVKRLKGRPFALLGVNCDDARSTAQRAVKKDGLTWRSWWDGSRTGERIATQWQVNSFPMIYVLDARGVIRYKFNGYVDRELDQAVDRVLKEHAGGRGEGKK